jgi:hypothetical protein
MTKPLHWFAGVLVLLFAFFVFRVVMGSGECFGLPRTQDAISVRMYEPAILRAVEGARTRLPEDGPQLSTEELESSVRKSLNALSSCIAKRGIGRCRYAGTGPASQTSSEGARGVPLRDAGSDQYWVPLEAGEPVYGITWFRADCGGSCDMKDRFQFSIGGEWTVSVLFYWRTCPSQPGGLLYGAGFSEVPEAKVE